MTVPPSGAHGGDGLAVARSLGLDPATVVDLSMSLNPFGPDVAALAARHLDAVGRYPDRQVATRCLAAAMGVDPDRLVLTSGGSEAISLVAAAIGGRVLSEPEFALHPRGVDGPIWRSNPHNPSGLLAGPENRADVWDEAFYALATGAWTRGDASTIVVGSLTKLFACPGLRLGYVLADEAGALTSAQPGWPIGGIELAVLPELLERADLAGWSAAIAKRRLDLVDVLASHGFDVDAADAPWVLASAPGLRERLAAHGVVVRDCGSFGWPDTVRIAVPDDRALTRLDEALTLIEEH